jgi:hypothetical protein
VHCLAGIKEKRRRRRKNRGNRGPARGGRKVEGAKDLIANCKIFKGLKVKLNFPLIQGSNGEMTKIENV